jgi:Protein of unknown function (DUF692)
VTGTRPMRSFGGWCQCSEICPTRPSPPNTLHVQRIGAWRRRFGFPWHSDHLSFNRFDEPSGHSFDSGLTIPVPYDESVLRMICERVEYVLREVPAPFLLENNVYYFAIPEQEMSEPEFLNELAARSGCGLLLDIHNVYVNARNHGFDGWSFIEQIDLGKLVEVHIAGGLSVEGTYLDAHSGACPEQIWEWLAELAPKGAEAARRGLRDPGLVRPRGRVRGGAGGAVARARSLPGMTLAQFQTALAELISLPGRLDAVRAVGSDGLGTAELDERERRRLVALARDPRLEVAVLLHVRRRLAAVLTALPHSCRLLGDGLIDSLLREYRWAHPPRSNYFADEGLEFACFLSTRDEVDPFVSDVLALETGVLEIHLEEPDPSPLAHPRLAPGSPLVDTQHDPEQLASVLRGGPGPAGPDSACTHHAPSADHRRRGGGRGPRPQARLRLAALHRRGIDPEPLRNARLEPRRLRCAQRSRLHQLGRLFGGVRRECPVLGQDARDSAAEWISRPLTGCSQAGHATRARIESSRTGRHT